MKKTVAPCAPSAVLLLLVGGLLCPALSSSAMPIPNVKEESASEQQEAAPPPDREAIKKRMIEYAMEVKTRLGFLHLGANGELVVARTDEDGMALEVIPKKDGLLLRNSVLGDYARVLPDGTIVKLKGGKQLVDIPAMPSRWEFRNDDGSLAMPAFGTVLLPGDVTSKREEWKPRKPRHCIGAVMITAEGDFFLLPHTMKPFENILWVVRDEDGGLDFVHAGPLKKGSYLHVSKDRSVTWNNPENSPSRPDQGAIQWPYIRAEDQTPVLPTWRDIISRDFGAAEGPETILEDGTVILPGWSAP